MCWYREIECWLFWWMMWLLNCGYSSSNIKNIYWKELILQSAGKYVLEKYLNYKSTNTILIEILLLICCLCFAFSWMRFITLFFPLHVCVCVCSCGYAGVIRAWGQIASKAQHHSWMPRSPSDWSSCSALLTSSPFLITISPDPPSLLSSSQVKIDWRRDAFGMSPS